MGFVEFGFVFGGVMLDNQRLAFLRRDDRMRRRCTELVVGDGRDHGSAVASHEPLEFRILIFESRQSGSKIDAANPKDAQIRPQHGHVALRLGTDCGPQPAGRSCRR